MKKLFFLVAILFISQALFSQEVKKEIKKEVSLIQNTSISGNWFLAYTFDETKDLGLFKLKRGYFTIKTKLNDALSVRYTQDITLDKEGSDAGNVEIRLKYLYMKMKLIQIEALKNTYFEIGLIHRPWLDFEQHVNRYRVQGKMFVERYHLINSADFGVMYAGLIGGKIDKEYQKEVNKKYPGKYGSFAIGLFNGPGYHAIETNSNKTVEGRLSLRPLPEFMPGLQLSYAFAYGQNNTVEKTDFLMNVVYLSSESKYHSVAVQYYNGYGAAEDDYIDIDGSAFKNDGYSVFGELKIPEMPFSLFARYDNFISHQAQDVEESVIVGGLAYRFLKNKLIFDIDHHKTAGATKNIYELALEIKF